MGWEPRRAGKVGIALLIANEIRGLAVVAGLLGAWPHDWPLSVHGPLLAVMNAAHLLQG
jgi:hypothetical protein